MFSRSASIFDPNRALPLRRLPAPYGKRSSDLCWRREKKITLTAGEFGRIESSPGVCRSFCAKCGTPMVYERDELPGEIHLYVGTLEHSEDIFPTLEVFCRERLPWLKLTVDGDSFDGLPAPDAD